MLSNMTNQELQEQAEKMYPVKLIVIDASLTVDSNKLSRDAFIEGAKWMQERDKWISCEDRLPENRQQVMFYRGNISEGYYLGVYKHGIFHQ